MTSLKHIVLDSLAWTGLGQVFQQTVRIGVGIALARLLSPTEFGLLAMVVMLTGFAEMFLEIGLGPALVQRSDLDERHRTTVFLVTLVTGTAVTILFVLLAPAIAAFYGVPILEAVTLLLAVNFVIAALRCVPLALLMRSMRFRAVAMIETAAAFASGIAAIVAAILGLGLWSLVLHLLLNSALRTILLWIAARWRPAGRFSFGALTDVLGFGSGVLGFRVTDYWSMRIDHLLIGKFIGASSLGVYGKAFELVLFPARQIGAVVTRVMFPALSSIGDDPVRMKRIYLRVVGVIALVAFPCVLGLGAVADSFVFAVLGSQWAAMIPLLRILCLVGAAYAVATTTGWLFMARGRADLMFRWGVAAGLVKTLAIVIGLPWGLTGVAISFALTNYLVLLYPGLAIPGRLVGLRVIEVLRVVATPFLAALAMAVLVHQLGRALPMEPSSVARLALQVVAGALAYAGILHVLNPAPYRELRALCRERWSRHRPDLLAPADGVALPRSKTS